MASSKFKVFAESVSQNDIQSDSVYEADTQRIRGVIPGLGRVLHHRTEITATAFLLKHLQQETALSGQKNCPSLRGHKKRRVVIGGSNQSYRCSLFSSETIIGVQANISFSSAPIIAGKSRDCQ